MFLFSWIPARPSAWSSFYGVDLAFCMLAGALEASQIFSTERQNEHTEAPSRSKPWSAWHTRLFTSTSEALWYLMSHLYKANTNVTGCCIRLRSQYKFLSGSASAVNKMSLYSVRNALRYQPAAVFTCNLSFLSSKQKRVLWQTQTRVRELCPQAQHHF